MNRNTIRIVLLLGSFSIISIIVIQAYWVSQAFDLQEKKFNQSINIALRKVAEKMAAFNNNTLPNEDPVNQMSSDYYIVNLNDVIDANILEHFLKTEFIFHGITLDFEYAIYDCTSDKMMYGDYIQLSEDAKQVAPSTNLPKWDEFIYYFGVKFPNKNTYLLSEMRLWIFFTLILFLAIIFFSYAMIVILRQKRLSEIQRDFINNMTHEFKTPISTIAISADVLMDENIINNPQKLVNYANIIRDENNRLRNQVEKVLQIASVDKGEVKLKKERLNLHELIQQVIQNFELSLKQQDGTISCSLDAAHPEIMADKVHLTNMIYNLLDNAIKYTRDKPDIHIKTNESAHTITLSIEDNGLGIKKEDQSQIFEKFFRIPTGNVHNVKGFGLGLHYVKNMVQAHRWKIKLDSILGRGSTFTITIPIAS